MNDGPRYVTLQDYLRVIREQRWLIVVVTGLFAVAAFALSARKEQVYSAIVRVQFRAPELDLGLTGGAVGNDQSPEQRAAVGAQLVGQAFMARRVKRDLNTSLFSGLLRDGVDAQPEARTNLVAIEARWNTALFAQALANSYARQVVQVTARQERHRLEDVVRSLRQQYDDTLRTSPRDTYTRSILLQQISRVGALEKVVQPADITGSATLPTAPVAPKPVRDALLGGLLGLVIGLIAAFVRDSLDRRLRSAKDVRAHLELPVLARVSQEGMGRVMISANGHKPLPDVDREAFRILRTNLTFIDVDRDVRTVLVTSPMPEEGKSTVAASLAGAAVLGGDRTLLVECDLRRPALARRLSLKGSPGLSDLLAGKAGEDEVVQRVAVKSIDGQPLALDCIMAGTALPRPAEMLGSQRFRDFLESARERYDTVVLDSSPLLSVSDALELLPRVDAVLLCVRATRTTRDQADAARTALENLPARPTGLVVTGLRPGDEGDYGYYAYAYGKSAD